MKVHQQLYHVCCHRSRSNCVIYHSCVGSPLRCLQPSCLRVTACPPLFRHIQSAVLHKVWHPKIVPTLVIGLPFGKCQVSHQANWCCGAFTRRRGNGSSNSSSSFCASCFQARVPVARRAETERPRRGLLGQSVLEVLPNPLTGGHLLPPPHNGGMLRRACEYRPECVFLKSLHPVSRWRGDWNDSPLGDYKDLDAKPILMPQMSRFVPSHTLAWTLGFWRKCCCGTER